MISVPAGAEGVEIRGIETMAGREVNEITFTDCRVGAERLVGVQGEGWSQLMAGLNHERLIIAAQALGIAQRAFEDALAYVKARRQLVVPSAPSKRSRTASPSSRPSSPPHACSSTTPLAGLDIGPQADLRREASMCKLKASELAKRAALEGMQMLAGPGTPPSTTWSTCCGSLS